MFVVFPCVFCALVRALLIRCSSHLFLSRDHVPDWQPRTVPAKDSPSGLVLVRLSLWTSQKWRELVPSGRFVCRCHAVFFSGVPSVFKEKYVLFCFVFRLHAFVEAAALRSIVLRYAGAPIATSRFFFPSVFNVPFPLSLCMESTSYVLSFRMVFFYLVTTGWIFDISLFM